MSILILKPRRRWSAGPTRSEEHTSELQSQSNLVCRLLLEKKKIHEHPGSRPVYHKHRALIAHLCHARFVSAAHTSLTYAVIPLHQASRPYATRCHPH